ncbi:hypothetical protein ES708_22959 [subsurface metagenome]
MIQTNRIERYQAIFKGLKVDGKQVIGEMCSCGHTRFDHQDHFSIGHGKCLVKDCICGQFTWQSWELA